MKPMKHIFIIATLFFGVTFSYSSYANNNEKQAISFSYDRNSFVEDRKLIEVFLKKEIEDFGMTELFNNRMDELKSGIGLYEEDLNEDGYKEVFLYISHRVFCGLNNCELHIFSGKDIAKNKTIKSLLDVSVAQEGIYILHSETNGYYDIEFKDIKNNGSIWKFGDSEYQYDH